MSLFCTFLLAYQSYGYKIALQVDSNCLQWQVLVLRHVVFWHYVAATKLVALWFRKSARERKKRQVYTVGHHDGSLCTQKQRERMHKPCRSIPLHLTAMHAIASHSLHLEVGASNAAGSARSCLALLLMRCHLYVLALYASNGTEGTATCQDIKLRQVSHILVSGLRSQHRISFHSSSMHALLQYKTHANDRKVRTVT